MKFPGTLEVMVMTVMFVPGATLLVSYIGKFFPNKDQQAPIKAPNSNDDVVKARIGKEVAR